MIEELTPEAVASEIHLLREDTDYQGAFLFVEGDTDIALFSNFIDGKNCLIRMVKGRDNVLKLIDIVEASGEDCCLAIVDADFWHIEKKVPQSKNILLTDTHDIETMIFKTVALDKVLSEYITNDKLESLQKKYPNLRLPILSVAYRMAIIRWVSHFHKLGINFYADQFKTQTIEWEPAINIDKFEVDFEKLLDIVCSDNYGSKMKLRPQIYACIQTKYDFYEFCNGHDVIYITLLFMRRRGRRRDVEGLTTKSLERMFRLAYEAGFFKETALYASMVQWQQAKGTTILKI